MHPVLSEYGLLRPVGYSELGPLCLPSAKVKQKIPHPDSLPGTAIPALRAAFADAALGTVLST